MQTRGGQVEGPRLRPRRAGRDVADDPRSRTRPHPAWRAVSGPPAYMAPEQLNGGAVDARSESVCLWHRAVRVRHRHASVLPQPRPLRPWAALDSREPTWCRSCPSRPRRSRRPSLQPSYRCLRKDPEQRFSGRRGPCRCPRPRRARWRRFAATRACLVAYSPSSSRSRSTRRVDARLAGERSGPAGWRSGCFSPSACWPRIAGVFRGHLLFAHSNNPVSFGQERRRNPAGGWTGPDRIRRWPWHWPSAG